MKKSKNKENLKLIVLQEIKNLFEEAKSNPEMANEYVKTARKLAMKINLKIPKEYKRKYCKHCYNYFKSGNYRVRTKDKTVIYYCLKCKKYMKFKINTKTT